MASGAGMEQHREMACKWRSAIVGDERGKIVALNEGGKFPGVLNSECGWDVHVRLSLKAELIVDSEL